MHRFILFFIFICSSVFSLEIVGREDLSEGMTTCKARLDNGLEVYLVSDPRREKGAVGLAVEAGSFNDPYEHPGMAHFLEHLLFMGTETYPEEKDFLEFINDHGGTANAFTMHDRTVYGFSIYDDWFDETLDRFSHFFIDPLFTESAIQREMHAVDHEFGDNYEDDFIRVWRILKQTGRQDHPNALFSIGNITSLKKTTPKAVKRWFHKHYIANKMHLAVFSGRSIEQMAGQIEDLFSPVLSGPSTEMPLSSLLSEEQLGKMIYVEPIKDQKVLDLIWELPSKFAMDNERSAADLVIQALSNGDEYGLVTLLREEGLARNIGVQKLQLSKTNLLLDLEISLTDKGLENTDLVILRIFEAIAKLKELDIPEYMFDDLKRMHGAPDFLSGNLFTLALETAQEMIAEEFETFPKRSHFPQIYDPLFIKEFIRSLTPQSCAYTVLADPKITGVKPNMLEKWMGGRFAIKPISAEKLLSWEASEPHPQIELPRPFPEEEDLSKEEVLESVVLEDNSLGYVEFEYADEEIKLELLLEIPELDGSVDSKVLTEIFIEGVYEKLDALMNQGLEFDFFMEQESRALNLSLIAPSDHLLGILKNFKEIFISKEDFEKYKELLAKQWGKESNPLGSAQDILESVFYKEHFTNKQLLEVLCSVTYEQFSGFLKDFLSTAYITGNIHGRLEKEEARNLWTNIKEILAVTRLEGRIFAADVKKPSLPAHFRMETGRIGSACILLIEQGTHNYESWAAHEIIGTILKNDFFDDLRTKQQIAYTTETQSLLVDNVLYQYFSAQSSTWSAEELLEKFDDFVRRFSTTFSKRVSEKRFSDLKNTILRSFKGQSEDILEFAGVDEDSSMNEQALQNLTYEDLCSAVDVFFLDNPKKLTILVEGQLRKID